MDIGELRTTHLTFRTNEAILDDVDTETKLPGMRFRVGGKKMPVAASDFERKIRGHFGPQTIELSFQRLAAVGIDGVGLFNRHDDKPLPVAWVRGKPALNSRVSVR